MSTIVLVRLILPGIDRYFHLQAAGHVDRPHVHGVDAQSVELLGNGELLEGAVDPVVPDLLDLVGAVFGVRGDLAHPRRFPDEMDVVLGYRVEHLVRIGQAQGGGLPPALGEEVIEQARVPSHDPHPAAGAFRVAEDVRHLEDLRAAQVRGQGRGRKPVPHVVQVGMAPRCLDPVLVLGRPEEQFIVDHRVLSRVQELVDHVHLLLRRFGAPARRPPSRSAGSPRRRGSRARASCPP